MKLIERLSEMIEEEIGDADKYINEALKYKDERRGLADVFFQLSTEEMRHMQMLHAEVVKLIDEYRNTHGEPPEGMRAIYDYMHKRHIDEATKVKGAQALYRDGQ